MEDAIRVTRGAGDLLALVGARGERRPRNVPDDILKLLPRNGGVVMVTFVPGFLSPKVAAWTKLQTAETDAAEAAVPERRGGSKRRRRVDEGATRRRARRSATSPTTSTTSGRSPASITSASAATSTASPACRPGPGGRLDVSGADRGTAPPRLQRRRHEEDPRAQHPARDAAGGEGVEEAADANADLSAKTLQVPDVHGRQARPVAASHRDRLHAPIVALGDSHDRRDTWLAQPARGAARGQRRRAEPVAYWLMRAHPDWDVLNRGVNGERSDEIARPLRSRRRCGCAGAS